MNKTAVKIDLLTEKVVNMKNIKATKVKSKNTSGVQQQEFGKGDIESGDAIAANIDADSIAAFVVFEYSESMARCVEDYAAYSSFPRNLFTPSVSLISS